jgi:hypothetical protein
LTEARTSLAVSKMVSTSTPRSRSSARARVVCASSTTRPRGALPADRGDVAQLARVRDRKLLELALVVDRPRVDEQRRARAPLLDEPHRRLTQRGLDLGGQGAGRLAAPHGAPLELDRVLLLDPTVELDAADAVDALEVVADALRVVGQPRHAPGRAERRVERGLLVEAASDLWLAGRVGQLDARELAREVLLELRGVGAVRQLGHECDASLAREGLRRLDVLEVARGLLERLRNLLVDRLRVEPLHLEIGDDEREVDVGEELLAQLRRPECPGREDQQRGEDHDGPAAQAPGDECGHVVGG